MEILWETAGSRPAAHGAYRTLCLRRPEPCLPWWFEGAEPCLGAEPQKPDGAELPAARPKPLSHETSWDVLGSCHGPKTSVTYGVPWSPWSALGNCIKARPEKW